MHLLILGPPVFDHSTGKFVAGGRERLVQDIAGLFVEKGASVLILQKGRTNERTVINKQLTVESVSANLHVIGDLPFAFKTRAAVAAADLVCYAGPEEGFPFFARRAFAIQHGVWWDRPGSRPWDHLVKCVQYVRNITMCKRVTTVICVDTAFKNYLRLHGAQGHAAASKCYYIPNYVKGADDVVVSREDIRRRFKNRRILFLRRLEAIRGCVEFVEACGILQRAHVQFCARIVGWGSCEAEVRRLVLERGLSGRVQITTCGLEQSLEVIDDCTISVVPTQYEEGTSFAAIESISVGVPVVATDVGGLGNVIVPEFNGLIANCDPQSLALAMARLMENEEAYTTMSLNCLSMKQALSYDRWRDSLLRQLSREGLLPNEWSHPSMTADSKK
jgi:glycosyltransferase involved in cell wall biosynthesis